MSTTVNDRIDVRISKEQKELVKYASTLCGLKNLSEFVVFCISKEAKQIIKENNNILKSLVDPIDNNAASFYNKYGFVSLPTSKRMLISINTIKKLINPK